MDVEGNKWSIQILNLKFSALEKLTDIFMYIIEINFIINLRICLIRRDFKNAFYLQIVRWTQILIEQPWN